MSKKLILLALFVVLYTITHAQYGWMMGTWKSTNRAATLSVNVTSIIQITDVSGESFTGTKTSETNNGSHAKITISIAGFFRGKTLYLQNGEVVRKEPENTQWPDCSACTQVNKLVISRDSLILIDSISGCDNRCDGETFYYRLLSEYDASTQHHLVDEFGRPADIIGFRPFHQQEDKTVASGDNNEPVKNDVAAGTTVTDETRLQHIHDSTADAIKKEEKRRQDSLDNIARIKQQQTDDSARLAQRKKQQFVADSLNLAKQKEQQRINDSLQSAAATNLQKQRTADSVRNVQAGIRQQEITDSLAAVRKQQYNDSLQKAALVKAVPRDSSSEEKALTSRTSVLLNTYHITSPDILIELFDNGEIDGDRVTVYHNNEIIVSNQMLSTKPITLNIHADATNREHEFVLVAENLGSIPPNSALMRITAGKQSYKLSVNTDMKTNARIVFYYDGN